MRGRSPCLAVLLLFTAGALLSVPVGAQSQAVILHETPGETYPDNLNRFGWAFLNNLGAPVDHQNAEFMVSYRNTTLFSTTGSSGHDYDGVDRYYIAFPGPGDYQITVGVPDEQGSTAWFNGTVDARSAKNAMISWDPPTHATTGEPVMFSYRVVAEDGDPIAHAQVRFEVWNLDRDTLVFETDTHAHQGHENGAGAQHHGDQMATQVDTTVDPDGPDHRLDYTFEESGAHLVRLSAYHAHPTDRVLPFVAFTTQHRVQVEAGPPGVPGIPTTTPLENRVDEGTGGAPYRIFAAYDPYTSVGVGNPITLSTTVTDPQTQRPVDHLDYTARLTGPHGDLLFETDTLHSYDGVLEITTSHQTVGDYRLIVTAESTRVDWQGEAEFHYSVLPPAVTLTPGPHFVTVEGLGSMEAGRPGEIDVAVVSLAGEPFAHGEIHIRITEDEDGRLLLAGKLHTHADGRFPFTFTPPSAGEYTLHVDPFPLTPSPPTDHHGAQLGDHRRFPFEAGGSDDPFGLGSGAQDPPLEGQPTPVAVVVPLVAFATLAAWFHRRRW